MARVAAPRVTPRSMLQARFNSTNASASVAAAASKATPPPPPPKKRWSRLRALKRVVQIGTVGALGYGAYGKELCFSFISRETSIVGCGKGLLSHVFVVG